MTESTNAGPEAAPTPTNLGASDWMTIEQGRVDGFADSTDDHQFIHIDAAAANRTPFGGTIAHGFLTLSLLTKLCTPLIPDVDGTAMALNYGLNKVRFLTPVRVGSRIRAHATLLNSVSKSPGQTLLNIEISMEIDGIDAPALVAEWLVMNVSQTN